MNNTSDGGVEEGLGRINGDGRRLDLSRVVNAQYSVQMMRCGILHLKPV